MTATETPSLLDLRGPHGERFVMTPEAVYEVADMIGHYDVRKLKLGDVVAEYRVYTGGDIHPKSCTCPAYKFRGRKPCKHFGVCEAVAKVW